MKCRKILATMIALLIVATTFGAFSSVAFADGENITTTVEPASNYETEIDAYLAVNGVKIGKTTYKTLASLTAKLQESAEVYPYVLTANINVPVNCDWSGDYVSGNLVKVYTSNYNFSVAPTNAYSFSEVAPTTSIAGTVLGMSYTNAKDPADDPALLYPGNLLSDDNNWIVTLDSVAVKVLVYVPAEAFDVTMSDVAYVLYEGDGNNNFTNVNYSSNIGNIADASGKVVVGSTEPDPVETEATFVANELTLISPATGKETTYTSVPVFDCSASGNFSLKAVYDDVEHPINGGATFDLSNFNVAENDIDFQVAIVGVPKSIIDAGFSLYVVE